MSVPTQAGTAVVLGFGDLAITGYFSEDGTTYEKNYDANEVIKDQNGATRTKIRMDAYDELSGSFVIDDTAGTVTVANSVPAEGDVFSITDPDGNAAVYFEVMEASAALAAGAVKLTMTLRKEASMDYTPA